MIYCVEDENSIRELMIYTLKGSGFEAKGFSEGISFWEAMKENIPQLIMLDIMLPGEDGITILKKLRMMPETKNIPVIMATAKGSEGDRVKGLDSGADDYLCKPFGMMEMVSRIKAVLRRTEAVDRNKLLNYKDITMDTTRHITTCENRELKLTLKEYDLLKLFLENIGIVFTRDQLLNQVWDQSYYGETRTIDVHIATLRTKMGRSGEMIQTIRGVGYRML